MARLAVLILSVMIAVHFMAIETGLYNGNVWVDIPLHFLGGVLLGIVWLVILQKTQYGAVLPLRVCGTIGFALFGSFIWETLEWSVSALLPSFAYAYKFYSYTVSDVLSDMVFGLAGGCVVAGVVFLLSHRERLLERV